MTRRVGTTAATAVILVLLGVGIWFAMGNHRVRSSEETAATAEPAAPEGVVRLTEIKRQAAGIRVAPVVRRTFRHMHQVPGRLQYDDRRHVELKAATGGTVQTCTVKPGDRVEPGQVVAVLSSPEVGQARAEVLKRQAEWHIAQRQAQWLEQADRNVQELVAEIRRKAPWDDIERQFHNRPLGESRARLLSAYTRSMLAETMVASIQSAADDGAVAARTLLERRSERQAAEAELSATCEQSAFDSRLQRETAEAARDDAQRRLDIARQQLRTLLGYDEPLSAEPTSPESPPSASAAQNLSLVETRAPFAGTIESRLVSASERVAQGQTMMVLADTSRLWAVADVREQDWSAVQLRADQELELEFPALPGQSFRGSLYYVGREVVPGTNAIPLVASIDNPSEQLRPGLFVRVALPLEAPREVLAVPAASVVAHEEQSFVFIADAEDSFRRVDVRTGDTNDDWIEITEGVAEGDRVVTGGAFYLKSELLLEREE